GTDAQASTIALCAALFAIVLWATGAWYFGIPTSESHALIAGLTGAAIGFHGSFQGVSGEQWMKVVYGLLLSTFLGFFLGWAIVKLVEALFRNQSRRKTTKIFRNAQIAGA